MDMTVSASPYFIHFIFDTVLCHEQPHGI
jgi:hypothetical protein